MAQTFCLLHSEWTNQICYCRFSQVATAPGVTLASPCHCQLQFAVMFSWILAKASEECSENMVSTEKHLLKDIFCMSFNVKMPSSADRPATPAATTLIFLALVRLMVDSSMSPSSSSVVLKGSLQQSLSGSIITERKLTVWWYLKAGWNTFYWSMANESVSFYKYWNLSDPAAVHGYWCVELEPNAEHPKVQSRYEMGLINFYSLKMLCGLWIAVIVAQTQT